MKVSVNVIGYQKVDFVNDKNESIKGTQIYYLEPISNVNGSGQKPSKKWLPDTVDVSNLKVGENSFELTLDGKITKVY